MASSVEVSGSVGSVEFRGVYGVGFYDMGLPSSVRITWYDARKNQVEILERDFQTSPQGDGYTRTLPKLLGILRICLGVIRQDQTFSSLPGFFRVPPALELDVMAAAAPTEIYVPDPQTVALGQAQVTELHSKLFVNDPRSQLTDLLERFTVGDPHTVEGEGYLLLDLPCLPLTPWYVEWLLYQTPQEWRHTDGSMRRVVRIASKTWVMEQGKILQSGQEVGRGIVVHQRLHLTAELTTHWVLCFEGGEPNAELLEWVMSKLDAKRNCEGALGGRVVRFQVADTGDRAYFTKGDYPHFVGIIGSGGYHRIKPSLTEWIEEDAAAVSIVLDYTRMLEEIGIDCPTSQPTPRVDLLASLRHAIVREPVEALVAMLVLIRRYREECDLVELYRTLEMVARLPYVDLRAQLTQAVLKWIDLDDYFSPKDREYVDKEDVNSLFFVADWETVAFLGPTTVCVERNRRKPFPVPLEELRPYYWQAWPTVTGSQRYLVVDIQRKLLMETKIGTRNTRWTLPFAQIHHISLVQNGDSDMELLVYKHWDGVVARPGQVFAHAKRLTVHHSLSDVFKGLRRVLDVRIYAGPPADGHVITAMVGGIDSSYLGQTGSVPSTQDVTPVSTQLRTEHSEDPENSEDLENSENSEDEELRVPRRHLGSPIVPRRHLGSPIDENVDFTDITLMACEQSDDGKDYGGEHHYEDILDVRLRRGKLEYLVKWEGYKLDRQMHWYEASIFGEEPAPMDCSQGSEMDEGYPLGRFLRENKVKVERLKKQLAPTGRRRV